MAGEREGERKGEREKRIIEMGKGGERQES